MTLNGADMRKSVIVVLPFLQLLAGLLVIAQPASAFEYQGFKMGMSEAEMFAAAKHYGYKLLQLPNSSSYHWQSQSDDTASGVVALCNGRLFAANRSLQRTNFHHFIGLVQERQNHYGEPQWEVTQAYTTEGKQLSTVEAKWYDSVGKFEPSVSLWVMGDGKPGVTISYSGRKYICDKP